MLNYELIYGPLISAMLNYELINRPLITALLNYELGFGTLISANSAMLRYELWNLDFSSVKL